MRTLRLCVRKTKGGMKAGRAAQRRGRTAASGRALCTEGAPGNPSPAAAGQGGQDAGLPCPAAPRLPLAVSAARAPLSPHKAGVEAAPRRLPWPHEVPPARTRRGGPGRDPAAPHAAPGPGPCPAPPPAARTHTHRTRGSCAAGSERPSGRPGRRRGAPSRAEPASARETAA